MDGWGNDTADWLDSGIEYSRGFYKVDPNSDWEYWVGGNRGVDQIADLASGITDKLRVGSGIGCAIYATDENPYGRAAFVLMDVGRAAGLFDMLASPFAGAGGAGRGGKGPGGKPCIQCFEAGTEIQTAQGLKPIEEIKEGDRVLSYNEQTHRNEYQPVTQTFTRFATDVWELKVAGETKPIGVTSEHPFFVRVHGARSHTSNEGEWRETWQIRPGDRIRLASGRWARVLSVLPKGEGRVYNFTVQKNHNYFVGKLRLLTHNCGNPSNR